MGQPVEPVPTEQDDLPMSDQAEAAAPAADPAAPPAAAPPAAPPAAAPAPAPLSPEAQAACLARKLAHLRAWMGSVAAQMAATNPQLAKNARRLYIGGVPNDASEEELYQFFSGLMTRCGAVAGPGPAVASCKITPDKGYAFLELRTAEEASNALAFDGITFKDTNLKIRRPSNYDSAAALLLGPLAPDPTLDLSGLTMCKTVVEDSWSKVFVGGLPSDWTDDQVKELLSPYGRLKSFNLVMDKATGKSKGYCFCEFEDDSCVDAAIAGLHLKSLNRKMLTVKRALDGPGPHRSSSGGSDSLGGGMGPRRGSGGGGHPVPLGAPGAGGGGAARGDGGGYGRSGGGGGSGGGGPGGGPSGGPGGHPLFFSQQQAAALAAAAAAAAQHHAAAAAAGGGGGSYHPGLPPVPHGGPGGPGGPGGAPGPNGWRGKPLGGGGPQDAAAAMACMFGFGPGPAGMDAHGRYPPHNHMHGPGGAPGARHAPPHAQHGGYGPGGPPGGPAGAPGAAGRGGAPPLDPAARPPSQPPTPAGAPGGGGGAAGPGPLPATSSLPGGVGQEGAPAAPPQGDGPAGAGAGGAGGVQDGFSQQAAQQQQQQPHQQQGFMAAQLAGTYW